jgi:hypothetical protein
VSHFADESAVSDNGFCALENPIQAVLQGEQVFVRPASDFCFVRLGFVRLRDGLSHVLSEGVRFYFGFRFRFYAVGDDMNSTVGVSVELVPFGTESREIPTN